jgi:hypothetical protein
MDHKWGVFWQEAHKQKWKDPNGVGKLKLNLSAAEEFITRSVIAITGARSDPNFQKFDCGKRYLHEVAAPADARCGLTIAAWTWISGEIGLTYITVGEGLLSQVCAPVTMLQCLIPRFL